ncbi:MAG: hypothetical protein M1839_008470 [Geoglossum umbratile]|nr:MAG: hypothetical protein M1839_008470 [Geoglossum umbratile]
METWFSGSSSPPRPTKPKGVSGKNLGSQATIVHTTAALQASVNAPTTVLRRNTHLTSHQSLSVSPVSNPASASASTISTSSSSKATVPAAKSRYVSSPYATHHGRRYVADPKNAYPLPCDIPELNRQNLRTILLTTVYGAPFCAPSLSSKPPRTVLDVGCGTGLWSSYCHDYFTHLGYPDVEFTGLDVVPIAPDLKEQGVNWKFVLHDIRRNKLPFSDESFDMVFLKDMAIAMPTTGSEFPIFDEILRVLKPGGVIEIWESDATIRALLPQPAIPPNTTDRALQQAVATGTYPLVPGTGFSASQNAYVQDYNAWISKAFEKRMITLLPCTVISPMMLQEEKLADCGNRRLVVLLGEVRWEREGVGGRSNEGRRPSESSVGSISKGKGRQIERVALTEEQLALRSTALLTFVQMIESLEPVLKEASKKGQDEWDRWWTGMMTSLYEQKGATSGEGLEVGSWWARKL